MKQLSQMAVNLPRSGIRVVMDRAWEMGDSVIRLMTGEPDFATPPHIIDAVHQALDAGHTRYIPNAGLLELRQVVAEKFQRETGQPTTSANVLITHGAMMGLTTAYFALLEPGDEILLPDPGWPNYDMAVRMTGASVKRYPLRIEQNFLPLPSEIESLITERTKALMICSPSNPAGQVYDRALMKELVALAKKYDLFVLSDEVYQDIVFDGEHVSAAELDPDRSIVVSGVSKSFAMTGFRVGYVRATPQIIATVAKLQEPTIACGVAISQYGALAALTGPQDCVWQMRDEYRRRRDLAIAFLRKKNAYSYTPRGAFYLLIDVSRSGMNGEEFALELLQESRVAVAPGPTFGPASNQFIRISLASSEADIMAGLEAICDLLFKSQ